MSENEWTDKEATLSDKAAMQKYGLSRDEIVAAIKAGKLQYRQQSMHGNPWFRLLQREVERLVSSKHGATFLQAQKLKTELTKVESELRALKRNTTKLERRREELKKLLEETL
jgi:hypothetical protein